jgi:hypothetical protein
VPPSLIRNNHMLKLIGAVLLIYTAAFAQPRDTDGWGKVKWGMTVEQVKAAYGAEAENSTVVPGPNFIFIDRLTVPNVKIGELEMKASLQTPKGSDQIKQVSITLKAPLESPSFIRSGAFDRLKGLLIEKYGAPANEDRTAERSSIIKTLLWSLPSTTITLIWSEGTRYELGYVELRYKAVDKKALDVL